MLFLKECKKVICSLTFVLYCVVVIAMYVTQFCPATEEAEYEPQKEWSDYGTVAKEVPEILMPAALEGLRQEYTANQYVAYPIGFYKLVILNEEKQEQMEDLILKMMALTEEDYDQFRDLMRDADELIGGGSAYSDDNIVGNFSRVPKTYEDAMKEYKELLDEDEISGAYGRLYCDYMGIVLAVLPVFVAVSFTKKDKKSKMEPLVFSRRISSGQIVFTRYTALVLSMLLPVFLLTVDAQMRVMSLYDGESVAMLKIFEYAATWLIPNVLVSTAVGMLSTELYSGLISIVLQAGWWFGSMFTSGGNLVGNIGKFGLIVRHNAIYERQAFLRGYGDYLFNRTFYTVLSLVIVGILVFVYGKKRRGQLLWKSN